MAVRDSSGIWLDILTVAPRAGIGIEVDIYDGSSAGYAAMLATLENARDAQFQVQQDDVGSFSFVIATNDAKATINPGNLTRGNVVKMKLGGVYRFAGKIETTDLVPASAQGPQQEVWKISGRGIAADLELGEVYPTGYPTTKNPTVNYTATPAGAILLDQFTQAKARGAKGLSYMSASFTATHDSRGFPWPDSQTVSINVGTNIGDLARQMSALALDFRVRPNLILDAYVQLGTDHSAAADPLHAVILRLGRHLGVNDGTNSQDIDIKEVDSQLRTRLLVQGAGGLLLEVVNATLEADPQIGRREGFLNYSSGSTVDALNNAGLSALASLANEAQPLNVGTVHGPSTDENGNLTGDYEPFVDYDVGDWISIDIPNTTFALSRSGAKQRVVSITITQVKDTPNYGVALDLNSVYLEEIIRLAKQQPGGASASGGGVTNLNPGGGGAANTGEVALAVGDTPDFLEAKVIAGTGISLVIVGPPGAQQMEIVNAGLTNPATLKGDLIVFDGTTLRALHTGGAPDDGQVLVARSTATLGVDWETVTASLAGAVANAGGAPSLQEGTFAARPAFGHAGYLYLTTDTLQLFRDTGAAWALVCAVGVPGSSAPGDAAAQGTSTSYAALDHKHGREAWGVVGDIASSAVGDATAAGASGHVADAAHKHAREAFGATISDVGSAAAAGTATTLPRLDHVHRGLSAWKVGVGGTARYGTMVLVAGTNVTLTDNGDGSVTIAATGGGSSTLAADTDVSLTSPADGDLLQYVASASKWENKPLGAVGAPIAGQMTGAAQNPGSSFSSTKLTLGTSVTAKGITCDTTNSRITALTAGWYLAFAAVGSGVSGNDVWVAVRQNGSQVGQPGQGRATNVNPFVFAQALIYLNVGDYVEAWGGYNGTSGNLNGASLNVVSQGAVGQLFATNYRFTAYRSAAWTPANGTNQVPYDTVDAGDDPSGSFTTGASAHFTAPATGPYSFAARHSANSANPTREFLSILVNGTEVARGNDLSSSATSWNGIVVEVPYLWLNAGDTVAVQLYMQVGVATEGGKVSAWFRGVYLGSAASQADNAWTAPVLQNSWVNFGGGYAPCGYRKMADGSVRLRGTIKSGTATSGTLLFTLPAGYCPAAAGHLIFVVGNSQVTVLEVHTDGTVIIGGTGANAAYLSLDNISFLAEA